MFSIIYQAGGLVKNIEQNETSNSNSELETKAKSDHMSYLLNYRHNKITGSTNHNQNPFTTMSFHSNGKVYPTNENFQLNNNVEPENGNNFIKHDRDSGQMTTPNNYQLIDENFRESSRNIQNELDNVVNQIIRISKSSV